MENTKIAKKLVNVMIECGHIAKKWFELVPSI